MTNDYDNTFNAQNYGISKDNQFDFDQTQEQVNTLPTTKKPTQKKKATTRSKETTEDIYITGRIIRKKLQLTKLVYDDCNTTCLLYTSPSPRDRTRSRMPSSA